MNNKGGKKILSDFFNYNRTYWEDDITLLNAENMNNIEQGIVNIFNRPTIPDWGSIKSEEQFSHDILQKYMSYPRYQLTISGHYSDDYYDTLIDPGFYELGDSSGKREVVLVTAPPGTGKAGGGYTTYSDAYRFQLRFTKEMVYYRSSTDTNSIEVPNPNYDPERKDEEGYTETEFITKYVVGGWTPWKECCLSDNMNFSTEAELDTELSKYVGHNSIRYASVGGHPHQYIIFTKRLGSSDTPNLTYQVKIEINYEKQFRMYGRTYGSTENWGDWIELTRDNACIYIGTFNSLDVLCEYNFRENVKYLFTAEGDLADTLFNDVCEAHLEPVDGLLIVTTPYNPTGYYKIDLSNNTVTPVRQYDTPINDIDTFESLAEIKKYPFEYNYFYRFNFGDSLSSDIGIGTNDCLGIFTHVYSNDGDEVTVYSALRFINLIDGTYGELNIDNGVYDNKGVHNNNEQQFFVRISSSSEYDLDFIEGFKKYPFESTKTYSFSMSAENHLNVPSGEYIGCLGTGGAWVDGVPEKVFDFQPLAPTGMSYQLSLTKGTVSKRTMMKDFIDMGEFDTLDKLMAFRYDIHKYDEWYRKIYRIDIITPIVTTNNITIDKGVYVCRYYSYVNGNTDSDFLEMLPFVPNGKVFTFDVDSGDCSILYTAYQTLVYVGEYDTLDSLRELEDKLDPVIYNDGVLIDKRLYKMDITSPITTSNGVNIDAGVYICRHFYSLPNEYDDDCLELVSFSTEGKSFILSSRGDYCYKVTDTKAGVDQTFNPESENAQSGKAINAVINNTINDIILYVDEQVEVNAKIIDLGYVDGLEKLKSLMPNLQLGKSYQFNFYDPETSLGGVYVGSYIDKGNEFKSLYFHHPSDYNVIHELTNSGNLYEHPIKIKDEGNYYTTKTVEGALQELGSTLNGLEKSLADI